jgi:hypothetical protein
MLCQYFLFPTGNIKYINDTPSNREILKELCSLVKGAQKDDILVFVFSGHSGWYPCVYNNNSGNVEFILTGERNGIKRRNTCIIALFYLSLFA